MKVTELREKLRNLEKAELQALIVEMYKLIPKSVKDAKDIDALIDNPVQFKEKKKTVKATASTIDFKALKQEIELFIEHANAQYYIAPNRIVPKKDRSNWRIIVKRFIDQLTLAASNPEYQKDCADLFEKLYSLLVYATNHYIFVSEEPFYTLKIRQEEFLKRVIVLKKQVEFPKQWIRSTLQLILDYGVDRETLTSTLLQTLLEELPNAQLKEQAIDICEQLLQEKHNQLNELEKSPYKGAYSTSSSSTYSIKDNINSLVIFIFMLHSLLGEKELAIQYFEQHTIEKSPEVKLYIVLRYIREYQQIQDWLSTYERAVADGIKPRGQLQKEYMYIKKNGKYMYAI